MSTKYIPFEDPSDYLDVQASLFEIEIFVKSMLHSDFQNACQVELDELSHLLDDPSLSYTGRHYDKFRGAKEAVVRMQDIFHSLLEGLEEVQEANNEKELRN